MKSKYVVRMQVTCKRQVCN